MRDDDLIRRGDALSQVDYTSNSDDMCYAPFLRDRIAALPAVTAPQVPPILPRETEEDYERRLSQMQPAPCGECFLPAGETCDICGRVGPSPKAAPPQPAPDVLVQAQEALEKARDWMGMVDGYYMGAKEYATDCQEINAAILALKRGGAAHD